MDDNKTLSDWRLEKAEKCLQAAKLNFENEDYNGAANRSYFCIFPCIRSILALENVDFKKHSGVLAYYRNGYIKTGIFEKKMSDIAGEAFQIRNDSDYEDFYIVSKQEITEQIENAEYFFGQVKIYLSEK